MYQVKDQFGPQLTETQVVELHKRVNLGLINVQYHQSMQIYNYSHDCQYQRAWDDYTLQCRGLVLCPQFNLLARPLHKFFNLAELSGYDIPSLTADYFKIHEKMDGVLGIAFYHNGWHLCSRGSFTSDYAKIGKELLDTQGLYHNVTYLFEIIHPESKIIVDYKGAEKLVLLAAINTITGEELDIEQLGLNYETPQSMDWRGAATMEPDNSEGVVVQVKDLSNSGQHFRYKIKNDWYVERHRIRRGLGFNLIYQHIVDGTLDELRSMTPEELLPIIDNTYSKLKAIYDDIYNQCLSDYKDLGDAKSNAEYYKTCKYPSVLFGLYRRTNWRLVIWKIVKSIYKKNT